MGAMSMAVKQYNVALERSAIQVCCDARWNGEGPRVNERGCVDEIRTVARLSIDPDRRAEVRRCSLTFFRERQWSLRGPDLGEQS